MFFFLISLYSLYYWVLFFLCRSIVISLPCRRFLGRFVGRRQRPIGGRRRRQRPLAHTRTDTNQTGNRVFPGFNWVLLGFTGFYLILPGFNGFYWVLLGSTGFYWVLLGFTGFYWVLPGFT